MAMSTKVPAAIVGSGNIGTDLMFKLLRSEVIEPRWMVGIDPTARACALAARAGPRGAATRASTGCSSRTSCPTWSSRRRQRYVHRDATRRATREAGHPRDRPDARPRSGPYVIPPVNLREHLDAPNVNMITCGGQATIPMVYAVSPRRRRVATPRSSPRSPRCRPGPGTRANIDEFTRTTGRGVETIGGAERGKAIIILNPAEPPMIMRDTIFCAIPDGRRPRRDRRSRSTTMVAEVQTYVPGYRLRQRAAVRPAIDRRPRPRVAIFVEVEGAGDYLPPYAGNLDIMTAAATKVGEEIARRACRADRSRGGQA